jgi:hypothetical protein
VDANTAAILAESTARDNADTALGERIDTERNANDEYVKNMLHLGYYDTYAVDANGNYVVTRQTGYLKLDGNSVWTIDSITTSSSARFKNNIILNNYASSSWGVSVVSDSTYSKDLMNNMYSSTTNGHNIENNYFSLRSNSILTITDLNNYLTANPIFVQYQIATSYTETYEPNHFARIEPYALEHAKSEADRSSNLFPCLEDYSTTANGLSITVSNDVITLNGTATANAVLYLNLKNSFSLNAGTYTFNNNNNSKKIDFYVGGGSGINVSANAGTSSVFTLTAQKEIARLSGLLIYFTSGTYSNEQYKIMLNSGSVALPYQPYEGKTVHETGLTKSAVGLGNVDNTADKDKPISTATQTALDKKQDKLESGTNIKTIEGNSILGPGNINLDKSAVGLSNVDNTTDKDKPISTATQTALDKKQDKLESGTNIKTIEGNSILGPGNINLDKSAVGLSNVDNTSDLDKPVSNAVQTALNNKQNKLTAGTGIIIDSSNKISADVSTSVSAIDYNINNAALTGLALNGVNYKLAFLGNATGTNSLAIGYDSTASTPGANAYGISAAVTGNYGIAIGTQCTASGSNALTIGINGIAKNDDDIAIGGNSVAQNGANVALGVGSHAYGNNSIAIGDNTFNNISNTVTFDTTGINRNLVVASSDNIVFRNSNITDTGATDHNSITAVYSGATTLTNLINTSASNTLSSANSHSDFVKKVWF